METRRSIAGPSLSRLIVISIAFGIILPIALARPAAAPAPPDALRLSTLPEHVYRANDEGKFKTESWYFELVVHDSQLRKWEAASLRLETLSAGKVVKTTTVKTPGLDSLHRRTYFPTSDLPKMSMRRHFSIADEVFTFPLVFSERRDDAIDQVRAALVLRSGKTVVERSLLVPIERYVPKRKLIFPFKGPGIVTQGPFNNGGHAHRETMFAIDVMALTPTHAPMLSEEERNDTVAPDEAAYTALPDPLWAIGGNCVVIDHGNGEFSGLMHMQAGSVTVRKGDVVRQGQVVGRLGNSGDAYMPHLHYQLTTGRLIFASDGLPFRFENLPDKVFTRGTYFTAK